jgi:uncharacterized repeat protein (TIGR03803 family)
MRRHLAGVMTVVLSLLCPNVAHAQAFRVLHALLWPSVNTDGALTDSPLVQATDGYFYGTTRVGGVNNAGTVYKVDAAGNFATVHAFVNSDTVNGYGPYGGVIQGSDGNLYGTTSNGGIHNLGTIYKMDLAGNLTTMHSFGTVVNDGSHPQVGLLQASSGDFYGISGPSARIFKMTPTGTLTVVHMMVYAEGDGTTAPLIQANDGNFYGTAPGGGASGHGTVFKMDASGTVTVVHSFIGPGGGAPGPFAPVFQAADGYLYGTTYGDGDHLAGTVFRMNLSGSTFQTLHHFNRVFHGVDGGFSEAGLIQARDGYLYGTTSLGGFNDKGTVFRIDADGNFVTWHQFAGSDGYQPLAALVQSRDGRLFGTTLLGGAGVQVGVTFVVSTRTIDDFDADGRSDATIFRPTSGAWYTHLIGGGATVTSWGTDGDVDVAGDYDGDAKTDVAVWRPSSGTWFIVQSSDSSVRVVNWGTSGDTPLAGDVDGDGKDDLVIFRPVAGTWYVVKSTGGTAATSWGTTADLPLLADFDGDAKLDYVVFRPSAGAWYALRSGGGSTTIGWGTSGDVPVAGDFDGDGKADATVFRPSSGLWFVNRSTGGTTIVGWGTTNDVPIAGDQNGDGLADVIVWRPTTGTWYTQFTGGGSAAIAWGTAGDHPIGRRPGS